MAETIDRIDINQYHPNYTKMLPFWQFWQDTYLGAYHYVKRIEPKYKLNSQNELIYVDDVSDSYLMPNKRELSIPMGL